MKRLTLSLIWDRSQMCRNKYAASRNYRILFEFSMLLPIIQSEWDRSHLLLKNRTTLIHELLQLLGSFPFVFRCFPHLYANAYREECQRSISRTIGTYPAPLSNGLSRRYFAKTAALRL
ncbi:hypothetical protein J2X61_004364 [Bacillus sp. 3255]|nr:hypothetical protein [Bacillus sp. 3255]